MKPLHLPLFVVGMLAPFLLTAQSLQLTGSVPSTQSANVALNTTVVFTFNQPLQPGIVSLDSIGERFVVIPNDRIRLTQLQYTSDFTGLIFTVEHQPDVTYTWAFFGLRAANGAGMSDFNMVTYSTKPVFSPLSVEGRLMYLDPPPTPDYSTSVVMLMRDLSFMSDENSDGPQDDMLHVAIPDPTSGAFAVRGVDPGSYYVMAMKFESLSGRMEPSHIAIHENGAHEPVAITLSDASITGLELTLRPADDGEPDPVLSTEAFELARARMAEISPSAQPIVMEGRGTDVPAFGESYEWLVAYFNEADSIVTLLFTDGRRVIAQETMHYLSMPEEERLPVDLATIKRIPNTFLPSDIATQIAMNNGMQTDIRNVSTLTGNAWMEIRYTLAHFYFEYPEFVTAASNPFWQIRFQAHSFNGYFESTYLVDAVTGAFLGRKEESEMPPPTSFRLEQSVPSHLMPNVSLQTMLTFTFSEPIQPQSFNLASRLMTWNVMPADKLDIRSIIYSNDFRTVVIDVMHAPDTDFVWVLNAVRSANGAQLPVPAVVNYTTKSAASPLNIMGQLFWPDQDRVPTTDQAMAIVVLLDSPEYFLTGMEGPPPGILNAGTVKPGSWMYTIDNVRPGTYYPAVFVIDKTMQSQSLIAYGYLPQQPGTPMSITVTDRSLQQLNLPLWFARDEEEHHPIDVSEVVDRVRSSVAAQGTGAELITVFGREEIRKPDLPAGASYDWGFIFFEPATDTVQMVQAHSGGIFAIDRFHLSNIPEEERVPKELVQPLPGGFISSGHAMSTALNNGLAMLIQHAPNDAWMQVRYDLSRFYFRHPGVLTADSPPFWEIQFNAELWTTGDTPTWAQEAIYLVDATNGAFLHTSVSTGLEDNDAPIGIRLEQNYPNPFNPSTVVGFQLSVFSNTSLKVYDILGREVAVLVDGWMPAGSHSVTLDASALPSGVYLYRLSANGETLQRKLTLIR